MRPKIRQIIGIVIGLLLVGAVGYYIALVTLPRPPVAPEVIKVGVALPLTGKFAKHGHDCLKGYRLWIDEVNEKGGLFIKEYGRRIPLKLILYDTASDYETTVKLYEKLITVDKVDIMLSTWGSGPNFVATTVVEKYHYPVTLPTAGADEIYGRGFKYIFNVAPLASRNQEPVVDFLKTKKEEIKSIAIIYSNFLWCIANAEGLKKGIEKLGYPNIVLYEKYPVGLEDFRPLLMKVRELKPDALVAMTIVPEAVPFIRQVHEMGIKVKFIYTLLGVDFVEEVTKPLGGLAEGVCGASFWRFGYPETKEYIRKFREKYGIEPSSDDGLSYTGALIMEKAIEIAGTLDREKIAEVLHTYEITGTPMGRFKWDERGVDKYMNEKLIFVQVQEGYPVAVWPPKLAEKPIIFPWKE